MILDIKGLITVSWIASD